VVADFLDEALRVLAADGHLELDSEREVGREGDVDYCINDQFRMTLRPS
jgi:hypothetical protein